MNEQSLGPEERQDPRPVESIAKGREKNFGILPGDIVYVPESFCRRSAAGQRPAVERPNQTVKAPRSHERVVACALQ